MFSQSKIDLAVLHKLYRIAETSDQAPTQGHIRGSFEGIEIPLRRIEVALDELEKKDQVERIANPTQGYFHFAITREGFNVVDRALKVPNSFIARLSNKGDLWLLSDEVDNAVLNKLEPKPAQTAPIRPDDLEVRAPFHTSPEQPSAAPITINNTFSPQNGNSSITKVVSPASETASNGQVGPTP